MPSGPRYGNNPDPNPDPTFAPIVGRLDPALPTGGPDDDDETRQRSGRPQIELTPELQRVLNLLGQLQCTWREIAAYTGIGQATLQLRQDMRSTIERGQDQGKVALRRAQFRSAIVNGNPVMQIWLGKQLLKQSDKQILQTLEDGTQVEGPDSLVRASDAKSLRRKIERIRENLLHAEQQDNIPDGSPEPAAEGVRLVDDDPSPPEHRALPPAPVPEVTETFEFQQRVRHRRGAHFVNEQHVPNDSRGMPPNIDQKELHRRIKGR